MDQWQTSTGILLTQAAIKLAKQKPINEINVAELCRAAGTTRDTFYRYAARPIDVLAAALNEDLEELSRFAVTFKEDTRPYETVLTPPARALVEHVKRNQSIYRLALRPHLDSALRDVLIFRIEGVLLEHLTVHSSIAPDILGTRPGRKDIRAFAAYTASGCVGAIERMLTDRHLGDIDRVVEFLFVASAHWWLGRDK